jgi:hypothetical protein
MSFYLVVYTASHLIGAVSPPMHLDICAHIEDQWATTKATTDGHYTFVCEEHDKPPKFQVKIKASDRKLFWRNCIERGHPNQCEDMPNGDVQFLTSARDKHGRRIIATIKKKDLLPEFYFWQCSQRQFVRSIPSGKLCPSK